MSIQSFQLEDCKSQLLNLVELMHQLNLVSQIKTSRRVILSITLSLISKLILFIKMYFLLVPTGPVTSNNQKQKLKCCQTSGVRLRLVSQKFNTALGVAVQWKKCISASQAKDRVFFCILTISYKQFSQFFSVAISNLKEKVRQVKFRTKVY